jgi:hypothetical protein
MGIHKTTITHISLSFPLNWFVRILINAITGSMMMITAMSKISISPIFSILKVYNIPAIHCLSPIVFISPCSTGGYTSSNSPDLRACSMFTGLRWHNPIQNISLNCPLVPLHSCTDVPLSPLYPCRFYLASFIFCLFAWIPQTVSNSSLQSA